VRGLGSGGPASVMDFIDGHSESDHRAAGIVPESVLRGDFDEDGLEDSCALVWLNEGGSGTSIYLAWFPGYSGRVRSTTALYLGNRIRVESMSMHGGGTVELRYVHAGDDDAMCCPGARRTVWIAMREGTLVETFRRDDGRVALHDLQGTTWLLTEFIDGNDSTILDRAGSAGSGTSDSFSLNFNENSVSGKGVCNTFFGLTVDEGRLAFSVESLGATKMFCLDDSYGLAEFEFLGALGQMERWEISFGRLKLYAFKADGGTLVMTFTPSP